MLYLRYCASYGRTMDSWSVFGRIALARFKVVPGDAGRTGCSQDIGQALISPPCRTLRVSRAEAGGRPTFPRAMRLAQQNIGAGSALHDRLSKAELPPTIQDRETPRRRPHRSASASDSVPTHPRPTGDAGAAMLSGIRIRRRPPPPHHSPHSAPDPGPPHHAGWC